ncbi:hypothetical protein [Anaeromassilibacillus sp. SJQ-1]|uniref:hypothetical protein n=1 Tax=Anaeromassilibacillus sp. SJQ-1 TaxID=3375419 RepID=UPI003988B984
MKIRWKMLILQLVISLGVAGLSALSTMNSMELYRIDSTSRRFPRRDGFSVWSGPSCSH